jgi:hypothetical protein
MHAVESGRRAAEAGSSAPRGSNSPAAVNLSAPQKIQAVAAGQSGLSSPCEGDQVPMIGTMQAGLAVQPNARVLAVSAGENLANILDDLNFGVSQRFDLD